MTTDKTPVKWEYDPGEDTGLDLPEDTSEETAQTPIQRAADAICPGTYCESHPDCVEDAGAALAAALTDKTDPDALAKAIDPPAFEDHPIERRMPLAAIQWGVRRKVAHEHAERARAWLLSEEPS